MANETNIHRESRLNKLKTLQEKGYNPYPYRFVPNTYAAELHEKYKDLEAGVDTEDRVTIAGRAMAVRNSGMFVDIKDKSGKIQAFCYKKILPEEDMERLKCVDVGDMVGVSGFVRRTPRGELTIAAEKFDIIAKSLQPLPEKFHGLTDVDARYRQRYVDYIMNDESKEIFKKRCLITSAVRRFFENHEFLEVETPMMHPIPGGATAKPFVTHHNALDIDLYLRIAPELYLKRLVVGGLERVFEINRSFRNEGISTRHNPEFTMIEFYEAFADYNRMMQMSEDIIRACAEVACGTLMIEYDGKVVDLSKPFDRFTILQAVKHYNPHYSDEQLNDENWLKTEIKKLGEPLPPAPGLGALQLALFEGSTEKKLWQPTFIIDYPIEVSPLARASDTKRGLTERYELFVVGRELANGYSELNDPEDQSARFKAQVAQKDAGDDEAMHYDADYIRAMEYGLPPTGGCGIGIDRLVMLLTNTQTIRDVILFPQMRPE